jgi:hypothetical protein
VDDAVANRIDVGGCVLQRRQRLCNAVFVDERQLEAG